MNLIFIDLETFGLDPYDHAVIDIAMISTTRKGEIIKEYSSKILPSKLDIEVADPEAIKINGFKKELWTLYTGAKLKKTVNDEINDLFKGEKYIPIGWNIGFDLSFLRSKFYLESFSFYHHPLDLMSMIWFNKYCLVHGVICERISDNPSFNGAMFDEKFSLKRCCEKLGVEVKNEHSALGDVKMIIECYRRLVS